MSSNANWVLHIRTRVHKELAQIPARDYEKIVQVIESLPFNPFAGDIEKMRGEENTWRRRVGNYRVFYEINFSTKLVSVFRIERRTSKTYRR